MGRALVLVVLLGGLGVEASAAVCEYTFTREEPLDDYLNRWGETDLTNPTCTRLPVGSVSGTTGMVRTYRLTYSAGASGNFTAGEVGMTANAEIQKEETKEQSRSFMVTLPTHKDVCIAHKVEAYDRYDQKRVWKHLRCWSLETLWKTGSTGWEHHYGPGGWIGNIFSDAMEKEINILVQTYQNSNIMTTLQPQAITTPPCPCSGTTPRAEDPGATYEDPDLEGGNTRELGFARPEPDQPREVQTVCSAPDGMLGTLERTCIGAAERVTDPHAVADLKGELALVRAMGTVAPTAAQALAGTEQKVAVVRALDGAITGGEVQGEAAVVARLHLLALLGTFTPPPGVALPSVTAHVEAVAKSGLPDGAKVAALELGLAAWSRQGAFAEAARTIAAVTARTPAIAPQVVGLWAEARAGQTWFQPAIKVLARSKAASVLPLMRLADQARSGAYYDDELDALYVAVRSTKEPALRAELTRRIARAYLKSGDAGAARKAALAAQCQVGQLMLEDKARASWMHAMTLELKRAERALALEIE